jgi:hypothetical protein
MSLPVVLIHNGNSRYLFDTLFQLRQSNPGIDVYLIGTVDSKVYGSLASHINIDEYTQESDAFAKRYRHFSTNSYDFELLCLQRWFVLRRFMHSKNLSRCLYIDSDILVYSNVSDLVQQVGEYGMTICGISGHSNFVRYTTLSEFCQYLLESYSDEIAIKQLSQEYERFLLNSPAGGISDMTFLYRYSQLKPQQVLNITHFGTDEAFDVTIDTGAGEYEMNNGFKKVVWKRNRPYCRRLSDNKLVVHHTLHFQGKTKKKMSRYVTSKSLLYYVNKHYYLALFISQKLKGKLFGV